MITWKDFEVLITHLLTALRKWCLRWSSAGREKQQEAEEEPEQLELVWPKLLDLLDGASWDAVFPPDPVSELLNYSPTIFFSFETGTFFFEPWLVSAEGLLKSVN